MNGTCEIVRDILPLYVEELASNSSRTLIEDHIKTCKTCRDALVQMQKAISVPVETDVKALQHLRAQIRRKMILTVTSVLLIVLTVVAGICVYGTIPVWMCAEDAIIAVEQMENGQIRVELAEDASDYISFGNEENVFCYKKLRLDWFIRPIREQLIEQKGGNYAYFSLEEGESLWYAGSFVGDDDVLIWGDGTEPADAYVDLDDTLAYVFAISLGIGLLLLVPGIIMRKRLPGKLCIAAAVFLMCCAGACLFVTDGYLLILNTRINIFRYNAGMQQKLAICGMTVMSFLSVLSSYFTIRHRNSGR